MRHVFLALAVIGAYPWVFFWRWFTEHGWSWSTINEAWSVNAATQGLLWDLTIAALALSLWVLWEVWQTREWRRLWAIVATFGIGVSCGLPLYIWLRMRVGDSRSTGGAAS